MRGRTNVPVRPNAIINGSLKTYTVADGQNIEKGDFVRVYTEPISYEIYPSTTSENCSKIASYGEYIIFRTRSVTSSASTVVVFDSKLNQLYSTTQLNGNDVMDVYVLNNVLYILTLNYVSSSEEYYIVNKCSLNSDYSFNVVSSYSFNPSNISYYIIGGLCALDDNIFIYLVGKSTKDISYYVMYAAVLMSDGTFSVIEQSNYSYGISAMSTSITPFSFVAMERISGDKFVVTYPHKYKYAWVYTLSLSDMTSETGSPKSAYVNSSDNVLVCALNGVAYTYNVSDNTVLMSSLGALKNWFCMLNSTHILDASESSGVFTIRHLYYEDGKWNDEVLCTVNSSIATTSYFNPNGNVVIINDSYYFLVQGGIIIKVKLQNEIAVVQGGIEFVKKANVGEFINGFTNESGKGGDEIQVYIPK